MENLQNFAETFGKLVPLIIFIAVWDAVWKIIAMWKAGRNNHLGWFICIAIFNTVGILPIIYLLLNKNTPEKD